jgi:hypothetical protein
MSDMKMVYSKENGEEILTDKNGFQVMMEWEKPYMEALVDRLNPTGHVLEVGFGMGYSASQIQKYDIKSHTIIEADPEVILKLGKWAHEQDHEIHIYQGMWQDVLPKIGKKFDSVFFDDSPYDGEEVFNNPVNRFDYFLHLMLFQLANKGCRLSYYSDIPPWINLHPATEHSCREYDINIPENCNYVPESVKQYNKMYLPVITYPYGILTGEKIEQYKKVDKTKQAQPS